MVYVRTSPAAEQGGYGGGQEAYPVEREREICYTSVGLSSFVGKK
jgi:hypothetical protein